MSQADLIQRIKTLCEHGEYDQAIKLTNEIENKTVAIDAHLLCLEHEERRRLDATIKSAATPRPLL